MRNQNIKLNAAAAAKLLQSCPTLCNPIDGSPAGSPVPKLNKEGQFIGEHFPGIQD